MTEVDDSNEDNDDEGRLSASPAKSRKRFTLRTDQRDPSYFFDTARVRVKGGNGGDGCVAWRREKGVPRGGPAGGSGGAGGDVYFVGHGGMNTLGGLRSRPVFEGAPGSNGSNKNRTGATGRDTEIHVPVGTVIRDMATGRKLGDLKQHGDRLCVARGGRGGRGNAAFKTDRNRSPLMRELGEPGTSRRLELELRLIADVGIVGCPNAGKSTLLAAISNAKPKIADYPFTTLVPNLGVYEDRLVLADIPGLLEGAHTGRGLGTAFLRHISRCRVLLHLVAGDTPDPLYDLQAIRTELELFSPSLLHGRPHVVLFTKMDLPEAQRRWQDAAFRRRFREAVGHARVAALSAVSGVGLAETMRRVAKLVERLPNHFPEVELEADGVVGGRHGHSSRPSSSTEAAVDAPPSFTLERQSGADRSVVWTVRDSPVLERLAVMTDWSYPEAADRFQRVLTAVGVSQALADAGAVDGDVVRIGDTEFDHFRDDNVLNQYARQDGLEV